MTALTDNLKTMWRRLGMSRISGAVLSFAVALTLVFAPISNAQIGSLPGMAAIPLQTTGINFSFLQGASDTTTTTTYTFAAQNLGTAAADRKIIVTLGGNSASQPTMTVGGVSATFVVSAISGGLSSVRGQIFIASVPTGSTGDVVVTFGGTASICSIALYRVTGLLSSTATATATDTASHAAHSATINVTAKSITVAVVDDQDGTTTAWSGVTGDYSYAIPGPVQSMGSLTSASAVTPLTVTATVTGGNRGALAVATWNN